MQYTELKKHKALWQSALLQMQEHLAQNNFQNINDRFGLCANITAIMEEEIKAFIVNDSVYRLIDTLGQDWEHKAKDSDDLILCTEKSRYVGKELELRKDLVNFLIQHSDNLDDYWETEE